MDGPEPYTIYIGKKSVLSHGAIINGTSYIGSRVVVGSQTTIFYSTIGDGCFISAGATIRNVTIAPNRFIPHGATVSTQAEADALEEVTQEYVDRYRVLYSTFRQLYKGYAAMYAKKTRSNK
nr:hypothetical protein [Paenibacillus pasadenensis]